MLAALMLKKELRKEPEKPYYLGFYITALIFFLLVGEPPEDQGPWKLFFIDVSGAGFTALLPMALAKRAEHNTLFKVIVGLWVVDVLMASLTDIGVFTSYLFALTVGAIAVYLVLTRPPKANSADYGLVGTYVLVAAILLHEMSSMPFDIDRAQHFHKYFLELLVIFPAFIAGVTVFLVLSYMLDANWKLTELATHDELTGLLNRRAAFGAMNKDLSRINRHKSVASIVLLDIDNFKNINDSLGHQTGDEVLVMVAKVLLDTLRDYDVACRYGGEEFLLFLPDTSGEISVQVAERIRRLLSECTFQAGGETHKFTASFGVHEMIKSQSIAANIGAADKALYDAKKQGRDRVVST